MAPVEFNMALTHETVSQALTDREVLVDKDRRMTYGELTDRSRRLATYLHRADLGVRKERHELANHESGQDHVALYLYNGTEYIEGVLGAFKSRCASVNVNYRYVADELLYLLQNSDSRAIIYHARFAPLLAELLDELPNLRVLLQVRDESGEPLLPGAVDYEDALASVPANLPDLAHSPDDLYVLYTGGTTGMPKGVLWRQHDVFMSTMGGRRPGSWEAVSSYAEIASRAKAGTGYTMVMIPPFMHGAAQWASFLMMHNGAKIIIPHKPRHLDAADVLRTVEREGASRIMVTGDAVMRPLLDEMRTGRYDLSTLAVIANGGAVLTPEIKQQVLGLIPELLINDSVGASETGAQGGYVSTKGAVTTGKFSAGPGATVVSEDLSRVHQPGHNGVGWLAQSGWVPMGYLDDEEKTARTFPVIGGIRYAIPGDRARLLKGSLIELLGRDSATINTGGEKVFAEEVEMAIASHHAVRDVTVCGRRHQRWGNEVVAVVQLVADATVRTEDLEEHIGHRLARYKLPKDWIFISQIQRSPSGKPDYRWAHEVAEKTSNNDHDDMGFAST